ncbi:MAG: hypothetical protein AAF236_04900 [Verrucomicrobiota bacterium]
MDLPNQLLGRLASLGISLFFSTQFALATPAATHNSIDEAAAEFNDFWNDSDFDIIYEAAHPKLQEVIGRDDFVATLSRQRELFGRVIKVTDTGYAEAALDGLPVSEIKMDITFGLRRGVVILQFIPEQSHFSLLFWKLDPVETTTPDSTQPRQSFLPDDPADTPPPSSPSGTSLSENDLAVVTAAADEFSKLYNYGRVSDIYASTHPIVQQELTAGEFGNTLFQVRQSTGINKSRTISDSSTSVDRDLPIAILVFDSVFEEASGQETFRFAVEGGQPQLIEWRFDPAE